MRWRVEAAREQDESQLSRCGARWRANLALALLRDPVGWRACSESCIFHGEHRWRGRTRHQPFNLGLPSPFKAAVGGPAHGLRTMLEPPDEGRCRHRPRGGPGHAAGHTVEPAGAQLLLQFARARGWSGASAPHLLCEVCWWCPRRTCAAGTSSRPSLKSQHNAAAPSPRDRGRCSCAAQAGQRYGPSHLSRLLSSGSCMRGRRSAARSCGGAGACQPRSERRPPPEALRMAVAG